MRPDSSIFTPEKVNRRPGWMDGARDEALIIVAGDMFTAGFDTRDIAFRLVTSEAAVSGALMVARERQRVRA